jgi:hypothetical protein
MSNNKDNLAQSIDVKKSDCAALHAHTREAEQILQILKAQKDSQGDVKPKETKK